LDPDPGAIVKHRGNGSGPGGAGERPASPRAPAGACGAALLAVDDRDDAAPARRPELDHAGAGGEDRVIAPEPGAVTGAEARPALADDDLAAADALPGEHLDAEHLRVRVTPVAARPKSLLVRHSLALLLL